MKSCRRHQLLLLSAVFLGLPLSTQAYQSDFHYGLTYWLGIKAGLGETEATHLASGNEWKDRGMYDARPVVAYHGCVRKDPTAFENAREHHFRSQAKDPAPPSGRLVHPQAAYASAEVQTRIAEAKPLNSDAERLNALYSFGGALHGFQDAFSHQGESQVPPGCAAEQAWTHPLLRNRGAWALFNYLSTRADHTHRWPDDCRTAAEQSYSFLLTFLGRLFPERTNASAWDDAMRDEVAEFCRAETQSEKLKWLNDRKLLQATAIAQGTTLDPGPDIQFRWSHSLELVGLVPVASPSAGAVAEARARLERMSKGIERVDAPRERRQVEALLQVLVKNNPAGFAEQLPTVFGRPGRNLPDDDLSLRTALQLRLTNRALAEREAVAGEILRALGGQGADIGRVAPQQTAWQAFYIPPFGQSNDRPYLLAPDKDLLVAFALLRHAPDQVIRIRIKPGEKPSIDGVDTLMMH